MQENYLCFLFYYALDGVFPDLFAFNDVNCIKTSYSAKDCL